MKKRAPLLLVLAALAAYFSLVPSSQRPALADKGNVRLLDRATNTGPSSTVVYAATESAGAGGRHEN